MNTFLDELILKETFLNCLQPLLFLLLYVVCKYVRVVKIDLVNRGDVIEIEESNNFILMKEKDFEELLAKSKDSEGSVLLN